MSNMCILKKKKKAASSAEDCEHSLTPFPSDLKILLLRVNLGVGAFGPNSSSEDAVVIAQTHPRHPFFAQDE